MKVFFTKLFKNVFLLVIYFFSFHPVFSQDNNKVIPSTKQEAPDTSINNQEYEIEYDTIYMTGDTIKKTSTTKIYLDKKKKPKKQNDFSLDITFSPLFNKFNREGLSEKASLSVFKQKKATHSLLSYSINSNFAVIRRNHLLSLGYTISNIRELQDYKTTSYEKFSVTFLKLDTVDTYFIIKGQDTSWVYVTKEREHIKIDSALENNYYKNRYIFLELPIIYGYKININNAALCFRAGLLINIPVYVSGKTISPDNSNEFIKIDKQKFKDISTSVLLGVELSYPLYKKYDIIVEPYYLKDLSSLFLPGYPIHQSRQSYGIRCGLKYKF